MGEAKVKEKVQVQVEKKGKTDGKVEKRCRTLSLSKWALYWQASSGRLAS